jgi:hypothetical protein
MTVDIKIQSLSLCHSGVISSAQAAIQSLIVSGEWGLLLESCVDNDVAAAIPAEQFDTIAAMVSEEEEVPGEGIGAEIFADELSETVETFAHIDRLGANVDASEFGKH